MSFEIFSTLSDTNEGLNLDTKKKELNSKIK